MRAAQIAALPWILLAVTLVATAPIAGGQSTATAPTQQNKTVLLTRGELLEAIGENASEHATELYFISGNGTWFHASPDGSTGAPAPHGNEIPGLADERFTVPPEDRPLHLWKVISESECSTAFYVATNASDATTFAVPGCPLQAPPTGAPSTESAIQTATERTGTATAETRSGPQPGFGVAVAALAVIGAGWLAARR